MDRLQIFLIDGNNILNRAFYGIMGSKMLMTKDGKYTNAVYGFLAILFKIIDDINPEYLAVAFDLKAPTKRHELYKEYKKIKQKRKFYITSNKECFDKKDIRKL